MKIDKSRLEALAALPDDALWQEVLKMAGSYGYNLPKSTPPHEELEKLRSLVRGTKINLSDAMKLLNDYKRRN